MNDIRTWSHLELTDYIIKNKQNSWLLKQLTNEEVKEWAVEKDREWLIDIVAGWNRDELRASGLFFG